MKKELVSNLKRQATRIFSDLEETKDTVLITEHGRPAAYLLNVETFEQLCQKIQILEGLDRGEKAIRENRILTHDQSKKRMERWLS